MDRALVDLALRVLRHGPTHDNAAAGAYAREHHVKGAAADIVKEKVHPLRCQLVELLANRLVSLIIHRAVEVEFIERKRALARPPAIPMTRAPRAFAICAAIDPTPPAAA
eukprot:CAMPEP_0181187434 /NCGR_PEP_ID=MMETSP1096-20121128/10569_1 /TAXON_ID=156174 ORGANISM="Chrysochromulina ericina, Strain CCMP281" /NCGR_SAMPLE_ID=MMETSP1096 /ASSEMBLY_ACC=CAM_ASM_000453 /LENGTH=109 /DNA_ID=CAMNT_0023276405 /DNA_START=260 /DNA_END=587 /DNA_ORIENTATION=-